MRKHTLMCVCLCSEVLVIVNICEYTFTHVITCEHMLLIFKVCRSKWVLSILHCVLTCAHLVYM